MLTLVRKHQEDVVCHVLLPHSLNWSIAGNPHVSGGKAVTYLYSKVLSKFVMDQTFDFVFRMSCKSDTLNVIINM